LQRDDLRRGRARRRIDVSLRAAKPQEAAAARGIPVKVANDARRKFVWLHPFEGVHGFVRGGRFADGGVARAV
jgi:hypothetical protein